MQDDDLITAQMENNGEYRIDDEPGKLFHVVTFNDLENNPTLERFLLNNGYDGYCYVLREIVPPPMSSTSGSVFNCYKLTEGNFVKMGAK